MKILKQIVLSSFLVFSFTACASELQHVEQEEKAYEVSNQFVLDLLFDTKSNNGLVKTKEYVISKPVLENTEPIKDFDMPLEVEQYLYINQYYTYEEMSLQLSELKYLDYSYNDVSMDLYSSFLINLILDDFQLTKLNITPLKHEVTFEYDEQVNISLLYNTKDKTLDIFGNSYYLLQ